MIEDLKNRLAAYFLKKCGPEQEAREMVNLADAQKILVLYAVGSDQEMKEAERFTSNLNGQNTNLSIDFVVFKNLSQKQIERGHLKFPHQAVVITKDELNLYLKPQKSITQSLLHTHYDLLIDLSSRPCYPLLFMTAEADAKTKVSRYFNGREVSDFSVKMKPEHTLTDFTQQVVKYLDIVNKKAV